MSLIYFYYFFEQLSNKMFFLLITKNLRSRKRDTYIDFIIISFYFLTNALIKWNKKDLFC